MTDADAATDARRDLRSAMRRRRQDLAPRERLDAAAAIAATLRPALEHHAGWIAGYWAVAGELPLHAVQSSLPATLRWCLPVLHEDGRLRFRAWAAGQPLAPNRHGIPEPAEGPQLPPEAMAVVLAPLLAFDATGQRLGMGGGWYDRSFAFRASPGASAAPWLVGVGYDWQEVPALPREPWDVPVDAIATPSGLRRVPSTP